jgi:hypothetical protein
MGCGGDCFAVADDQHDSVRVPVDDGAQYGLCAVEVRRPGLCAGGERFVGMQGGDAAERGDGVGPSLPVGGSVVGFAQVVLGGEGDGKRALDDVGTLASPA